MISGREPPLPPEYQREQQHINPFGSSVAIPEHFLAKLTAA
jgi:hypothetical protein